MKVELAAADISQADIEGVTAVLRSGRLAMGPRTLAFEHAVAAFVGVRNAVAVSSGTAGLHVILAALGVGFGDEVIVPSFTFAASVNAILLVGATPVFCDVEPVTLNLDPADVERRVNERTRAVMVVDVFGHPADWPALEAIAERNELLLVDDSCEALGSSLNGRRVGGFGAAACFAFYPNKQITTGEGGMVVTDDDDLATVARSLRNQGRNKMGAWLEHERLGFNYRLDELSASLGVTQMARLPHFMERRRAVAEGYARLLRGVPGVAAPTARPEADVNWFVYVVRLDAGIDREAVMAELEREGVPTRAYFSALHLQPYLRDVVPADPGLPVTEEMARRTLAIPFHTQLRDDEVRYVVDRLAAAVEAQAAAL